MKTTVEFDCSLGKLVERELTPEEIVEFEEQSQALKMAEDNRARELEVVRLRRDKAIKNINILADTCPDENVRYLAQYVKVLLNLED